MTGKVIAVANMKGGVGKTVTVVSIAEALAASGKKVLVIDLDAQASASACLAVYSNLVTLVNEKLAITNYLLLNIKKPGRKPLIEFVIKPISNVSHENTPLNVSLVPSSVELRFVERAIIHKLTEKNISMRAIEGQTVKMLEGDLVALRENFDFIIFDCAPGISIFTEVAVRLSDLVVIPTIPDILSTLGLAAFCNSVWRLKLSEKSHLPPPKGKPFVLISRRQATKQQNDTVERLKEESTRPKPAFGLFRTEIPQSADVPRAMALYPDNIINAYPTYSRKWGGIVDVMDSFIPELK